ncbi:hypothetical protein E2E30_11930 [Sphingomonas sp. AAP5]|nr:hypothetical protein E2E30_11930 [Sphingomonas sp. AAP5]
MLDYESQCSIRTPLNETVSIELKSADEVDALIDLLEMGIRESSRQFLLDVENLCSTSALYEAIAFRVQSSLLQKLHPIRENVLETLREARRASGHDAELARSTRDAGGTGDDALGAVVTSGTGTDADAGEYLNKE